MKKILIYFLLFGSLFSLYGCTQKSTPQTLEEAPISVDKQISDLENTNSTQASYEEELSQNFDKFFYISINERDISLISEFMDTNSKFYSETKSILEKSKTDEVSYDYVSGAVEKVDKLDDGFEVYVSNVLKKEIKGSNPTMENHKFKYTIKNNKIVDRTEDTVDK